MMDLKTCCICGFDFAEEDAREILDYHWINVEAWFCLQHHKETVEAFENA